MTNDIIDLRCQNLPIRRIGNFVNMVTKIDFQCKNCNYIWPTTFASLKQSKKCCPFCSGAKLNKEIINSRIESQKLKLISKYVDTISLATFKCFECHSVWDDTVKKILACPTCPFHNTGVRRKNNDTIDFQLKYRSVKRVGDYLGNFIPIDFQCKICDSIWSTTPCTILNHKSNCSTCYGNKPLNNDIIDEKLLGRKIKRLGDYINSRTPLLLKCEEVDCGYEWSPKPISVIANYTGCPECNTPGANEKLISNILKENDIKTFRNYKINKIDPNEKKLYSVDFYFPDIKLIIEYNGLQHYKANTCFGSTTKELAKERLLKQQNRDLYVDIFCKNNNIKIIWIDGRKYFNLKLRKLVEENIIPKIKDNNENN